MATGKAFVLLDTPVSRGSRAALRPGRSTARRRHERPRHRDSRLPTATPSGEPQRLSSASATPVPSVTTEVVITAIGDSDDRRPPCRASPTQAGREGRGVSRRPGRAVGHVVGVAATTCPYDVVADGDGVIVTTGNKGKVYRVEDAHPRVTLLTRVPAQQITGVYRATSNGRPAGVTANPGKLFRIGGESTAQGPLRLGRARRHRTRRRGVRCAGLRRRPRARSVTLQTRSGNTSQPGRHVERLVGRRCRTPAGESIRSPKARYLQWRANLAGKPGVTPVLTSVDAAYQPAQRQRPEVKSITVHPPGTVFLKPYSSGDIEIAGFEPGTSDGRNLTAVGTPWRPASRRRRSAARRTSGDFRRSCGRLTTPTTIACSTTSRTAERARRPGAH